MRKFATVAAAAILSAGMLSSCNMPRSCEGLSASEQDKQAASQGYEVEREDSRGNECELSQDGTSWSLDD